MADAALQPIPWRYASAPLSGDVWRWETPHFVGTISTEQRGFYWWLGDMVRAHEGMPVTVTEGRAGDFASCERDLREAVGKSYPAKLGYRGYAGPLATTFTLANGEKVDLGQYENQRVVVTIGNGPGNPPLTLVGLARVVHYDLEVDGAGTIQRVRPVRITQIVREAGGQSKASGYDSWTGSGRTHRGAFAAGCTGMPGFQPSTIEHAADPCPVHEPNGVPGRAAAPTRGYGR